MTMNSFPTSIKTTARLSVLLLLLPTSASFVIHRVHVATVVGYPRSSSLPAPTTLTSSSRKLVTSLSLSGIDEGNSSGKKKRRRRRKKNILDESDEGTAVVVPSNEVVAAESEENDDVDGSDNFVQIETKDVRDTLSSSRFSTPVANDDYEEEDADDDGDDDVSSDPFQNLIADARRLRKDADKDSQEGFDLPQKIKEVISTIVTVDFFVVFGLLLWFLAGIFCSYVIKNDAVQIAFNGIFEPIVQPALGLLMIASAAGAVVGNEEEGS